MPHLTRWLSRSKVPLAGSRAGDAKGKEPRARSRLDYSITTKLGDQTYIGAANGYQAATEKAYQTRVEYPLATVIVRDEYEGKEILTLTPATVGAPATYSIGSDSYAGKIVAVSKSGRQIVFDGGFIVSATLRKDGHYRPLGANYGNVTVGFARDYRDPSF